MEAPIVPESPVRSQHGSDRSDGAASPPNCSICLDRLIYKSSTDSCLHQFCFACLFEWSKIKMECPLCKQPFKSIIRYEGQCYEQYDVAHELPSQISEPQVVATLDLNFEVDRRFEGGLNPFRYRTTMTGNRRNRVPMNPEAVTRRTQLPTRAPQLTREDPNVRQPNPNIYRRSVACSADYYRTEPRELNRLVPWLNRELQVLLNNNAPNITYVLGIILDVLTRYDIRSPQFRDVVRPYFGILTDHFVHELIIHARINIDLETSQQGLSNEYVPNVVSPTPSSSSTISDDSDILVLDEAIDLRVNADIPSVGPHQINMPGPSTVGHVFRLSMPHNVPDVYTIPSSSSSSDNDCEVIGYVKPRHERTPEIIELISSDPDEVEAFDVPNENTEPVRCPFYEDVLQPSTSYSVKKTSPPVSTDSDSDSDSDYSRRRSRRHKSRSKKSKAKKSRGRKLSTSEDSDAKKESKRSAHRTIKKRISSSSECSSHETESKKSEKRTEKSQYPTRGTVRVRKDLIKKEEKHTTEDSSSTDTSNETDKPKNSKSRTRRCKRKYVSSSSDFEAPRNTRMTRMRSTRQTTTSNDEVEVSSKESNRKDQRYEDTRRCDSRSSSSSSYASQKEKKLNCRRRGSPKDSSDYSSHDDGNSGNRESSRKETGSRCKSKTKRPDLSSSDSEEDLFRSSSQCSSRSGKPRTRRKRSKRESKRGSKERKRSGGKTNSDVSGSNEAASSKGEGHSGLKGSERGRSGSKERRKSRKSRKESKHRKCQTDTKSLLERTMEVGQSAESKDYVDTT